MSTESFISASSFQGTPKVLTEAAIPAGTGLPVYKRPSIVLDEKAPTCAHERQRESLLRRETAKVCSLRR